MTSVSVTVTEVVPERPPIWPTMSLAWMTRTYWSLVSRSMLGRAVLMTPEEREGGRERSSQSDILFPQIHSRTRPSTDWS